LINLVTGGAGFIGSNLVSELINKGEKVICLDDLSTGDINNFENLKNNSNFNFIEHDIINPIKIKTDKIWHFACPASPKKYQVDPIKTSKTCYLGTINMLQLAMENKAKFLFASSSEIYGISKKFPQSENYLGYVNSTGIRSCYTEGKRIGESLCFDFYRKYNLDIKVARIFNTYGPGMNKNDGRLISNFIVQALTNKELTIYGDGNQTRSFCYIDDLVEGLLKLMDYSDTLLLNLGSDTEISILEVAKLIIEMVNPKLNWIYLPLPEDDPIRRKPDIKLAYSKIGWSPKIDINEGLRNTIKHLMK